jgi:peptide/nickel transport system substrate-binding protein
MHNRTLPPVFRETIGGPVATNGLDEGVEMKAACDLSKGSQPTSLTRRHLIQGAAAAGLAAPLAGLVEPSLVGAAVARQKGNGTTLIVGLDASPTDLDPQSQYDYRSTVVIRNIYEGLVGLKGSATDEFEGLVAESWEPNEDQSVWTFKLRPGLTFHDGSPCDSAAVKASYERLLAMGRGAVNVVKRFVPDPKQIETPDPETIVFNLGVPQPLFLSAMAATYGPQIINAKAVLEHEEEGDFGNAWLQLNAEGTGTGARKLVSFEPGQEAILERNPDYWRGWEGNHFERIIIRVVQEGATMRQLVEAGDVDIMDRYSVDFEWIDELQKNPALNVNLGDSTEVNFLIMTEGGPLASPEARQAMCYAYPYKEVIDGLFLGQARRANSPVAPEVLGYPEDAFFFETDLAKAKELLTAAGVPEGTELVAATTTNSDQRYLELFQPNLAEIGITLTIEELDQATYVGMIYGDAPVEERPNFMGQSWWPDYNDAWNGVYPLVSCDSWGSKGSNSGFYCNDEVQKYLEDAKDASTLESYQEILGKMLTIISKDDPPAIYYAQPKWTTVLQANIEGFFFNPINIGTYDFWKLSRKA